MTEDEYIETYKDCLIYQEVDTGYYIAVTDDGRQIGREATKELIYSTIKEEYS